MNGGVQMAFEGREEEEGSVSYCGYSKLRSVRNGMKIVNIEGPMTHC